MKQIWRSLLKINGVKTRSNKLDSYNVTLTFSIVSNFLPGNTEHVRSSTFKLTPAVQLFCQWNLLIYNLALTFHCLVFPATFFQLESCLKLKWHYRCSTMKMEPFRQTQKQTNRFSCQNNLIEIPFKISKSNLWDVL